MAIKARFFLCSALLTLTACGARRSTLRTEPSRRHTLAELSSPPSDSSLDSLTVVGEWLGFNWLAYRLFNDGHFGSFSIKSPAFPSDAPRR